MTSHFLLNKRLKLARPDTGYKSAIDPVFLAAALTPKSGQKILDMGAGIGTVAFCLLARCPDVHITGIDVQPELIEFAQQNAIVNNFATQTEFHVADHQDFAKNHADHFDAALMNPPYFDPLKSRPSPNNSKALANHGGDLDVWISSAHKMLKTKGQLALIYPASELDQILVCLQKKFGGIVVLPLWKKAGGEATRVIVLATKGQKKPLCLKAGLILHENDEKYTDKANKILTGDSF